MFRCLWKWLYIKRKKTRKWKGMIFWSFHFYCYKHNDENIYKSCAMWKQARNEFEGQVRSWNLRPARVTQKETGSGMSWGPELKPVAKVKHGMGEGVGGALRLAGGTGPASANSCQGRSPAGVPAAWHPQAPLGLSEASGETTDVQEHLLQPEYLGFFRLCPPSLFPCQITARSHK